MKTANKLLVAGSPFLSVLHDYIMYEEESDAHRYASAWLEKIMPSFTGEDIADFLLNCLADEPDYAVAIMHLLQWVEIPVIANLEPLKKIVQGGCSLERMLALNVLKNARSSEAEDFVLEMLRRTRYISDVPVISAVLEEIGTWKSFAVLMASLDGNTPVSDKCIYAAIDAIGERGGFSGEEIAEIKKPETWKKRLQGPPERFAVVIYTFAFTTGISFEDDEKIDRVAAMYMDVMEIDLSPYNSFREFWLCVSSSDIEVVARQMQEHSEGLFIIDTILDGTGVICSKETRSENIYYEMLNDYFNTRLRKHILMLKAQC
jgi:hypothetical protein